MTTKETVTIELEFLGSRRVIERPAGVFRGGVVSPILGNRFGFNVLREFEQDDGAMAPDPHEGSLDASLQVNVWGTSADYRALGRYFLGLAELDASADPDFHEHHEELLSDDGRTRLTIIVRKLHEPAA